MKITRQMKILTMALLCILVLFFVFISPEKQEGLSLGAYLESAQNESEVIIESHDMNQEQVAEEVILYVDVKGAINYPDVYNFNEGARIKDAIERAGGFREDAAVNLINLAQILEDQMLLYIPTTLEIEMQEINDNQYPMSNLDQEDDGVINVNTADEVELMTLPNIGPSKAKAIIDYRDEVGSFQRIEEIMEVSGIGVKTFENIKTLIEVR